LFVSKVDAEYEALKCQVGYVEPAAGPFKEMADHVIASR